MTQLRDAYHIRAAQRFGYPAPDASGAENTGDCPTLPRWLWAAESESTPAAEDGHFAHRKDWTRNGETYGEL